MSAVSPFDSFVIFAEMRTGSNFLEENLNAVPGLRCYGEAFNPHFVGHKDRRAMLGVTQEDRDGDPGRLLAAMRRAGTGLPGFRFFHDHDARVLAHVLEDRRCAKIVLTRNPIESYVSRKIAGQTGQWRLTDMKHSRSARVTFDAEEFAGFLDRIQGFQRDILHALQVTGQTAFYIGYEDIADLEVLNGLLAFLGVAARLDAVSAKLKKQNPEPLSQKVINFAQMEAALADLDRFDLSRTPNFEPRRSPAVPTYVAAPDSPLMFLPIPGGPLADVEGWLAALDGKTPEALERGFTQKTLRNWKRRNPGHRCFAVVTHPLVRAHRAFCTHILPASGPHSFPQIRETLRTTYGLPLPVGDPGAGFDRAAHRAAFLAFLQFLKGHLGGQTALRVDASWASQSSVLAGMAQVILPDMVLRAERLEPELAFLAAGIGRSAPALPQEDGAALPVPLAEIHDEEIETAARDAYQRDYMAFGYRAWRG